MRLFSYQETGVSFLVDRPMPSQSALLADEPGLGKTAQAIVAAKKFGGSVLVVCPAGLRHNWKREFDLWWPNGKIQIIEDGMAKPHPDSHVVIVSYDLIGKGFIPGCPNPLLRQLLELKFKVGIFDEAHYLKDRGSLRTRAILLKNGLASRCEYKFFLTGTPVLNRPIELYALMKACVPKALEPYDTYQKFAERFCGGHMDKYDYWDRGATHIEDLAERLEMSGFMLRRLKKDVLKELPEKFFQIITLDVKDETKPLIEAEWSWEKKRKAGALPPMEELSKIRHELALAKVPAIVDYIRDILESKEKVVVFAHHTAVIDQIAGSFAGVYGKVVIDGRTRMEVREAAVKEFQTNPECRIFIGQIQAAGTGITLTAADHVIFAEPSWVPGEINQCIDRCHRIGQTKSVTAQFLVAADSLEETMMKQLVDKTLVIKELIK